MKYLVLIIIGISLTSCATLIPNEIEDGKVLGVLPMQYGRVSYQATYKLNANREDIFRQARRWTAFNMANPSAALAVSDNQIGDVISRGSLGSIAVKTKNGMAIVPSVEYHVSVECMENQYRVTLTNFFVNSPTLPHLIEYRSSDDTKKKARENLKQIDNKVMSLLSDIKTFIEGELK